MTFGHEGLGWALRAFFLSFGLGLWLVARVAPAEEDKEIATEDMGLVTLGGAEIKAAKNLCLHDSKGKKIRSPVTELIERLATKVRRRHLLAFDNNFAAFGGWRCHVEILERRVSVAKVCENLRL